MTDCACGPAVTVPVGGLGQYQALVCPCRYELVSRYTWTTVFRPGYDYVYARRTFARSPGRRGSQVMAALITGYSRTDYANHDTLDNRCVNLRDGSDGRGHRNRRPNRGARSPHKGVSWFPRYGKWTAQIQAGGSHGSRGTRRTIGYFDDPRDAALAYDAAAVELHGEYACTNASLCLLGELPDDGATPQLMPVTGATYASSVTGHGFLMPRARLPIRPDEPLKLIGAEITSRLMLSPGPGSGATCPRASQRHAITSSSTLMTVSC